MHMVVGLLHLPHQVIRHGAPSQSREPLLPRNVRSLHATPAPPDACSFYVLGHPSSSAPYRNIDKAW